MQSGAKTGDLNVKLDVANVNLINDVLSGIQHLPPMSVNSLLAQFQAEVENKKFDSPMMRAIYKILAERERFKSQTYRDSKEHMTIGIGLDIQPPGHNDAKAVLLSVNPDWDFEDMQKDIDQPPTPLTQKEIDQVFYYTLIGAKYPQPPEKVEVEFQGEIPALIKAFKKHLPELADMLFKPNELVCLVSMAFNSPGLIGQYFCGALKNYQVTHDIMLPILQIMECSNLLYKKGKAVADANGLQNRRLTEAALFLGDPKAIHLSYRQYMRIKASLATIGKSIVLRNGYPVDGLPYGDNETTFRGGNTLRKEELVYTATQSHAVTYYGREISETIEVDPNYVHPVVLGGSGDKIIRLGKNTEASYPYLSGGQGTAQYEISSGAGHVLIRDNGNGKIILDDHPVEGIALAIDDTKEKYQMNIQE